MVVGSTTKTGRHDIAEILLEVALNTKNQIKSRCGDKSWKWIRRGYDHEKRKNISVFEPPLLVIPITRYSLTVTPFYSLSPLLVTR